MAKANWKTRYFEVKPHAEWMRDGGSAATFVDSFGVQADGSDQAKKAATAWLAERGRKVRSIAIDASGAERQLIAYVEPQKKATS